MKNRRVGVYIGIVGILSFVAGIFVGGIITARKIAVLADIKKEEANKNRDQFLIMSKWLSVKQAGKSISDFLEKKGYKKIAIYGASYTGKAIIEELSDSRVERAYTVDKRNLEFICGIPSYSADEEVLPKVDALIVSEAYYYNEIKNNMQKKLACPIISLEDILDEI